MCDHYHSQDEDPDEKLIEAALSGKHECLNALIRAEADVNTRGKLRKTPCMFAAQSGHLNCLDALIKAGADVNACGSNGKTAMLLAAETGKSECVKMLVEAGADVNDCETVGLLRGKTVLMQAAEKGHIECLNILLEAGADVNQRSKHEATALMYAANADRMGCIKALVHAGADVNLSNDRGNTALVMVADHGNVHEIQVLLKFGAHVNKVRMLDGNSLERHLRFCYPQNEQLVMFLFAAGEIIEENFTKERRSDGSFVVPEYLQKLEQNLELKNLCRKAIRKHLIDLDPHDNLFNRIPKLGLPSLVNEYLLYNMSLEDK